MQATSTPKRPRGRPRKSAGQKIEPEKPKRPRGRPRVDNKISSTERKRIYMLDPEKKERQRLACKRYQDKLKAAKDYCIQNNVLIVEQAKGHLAKLKAAKAYCDQHNVFLCEPPKIGRPRKMRPDV